MKVLVVFVAACLALCQAEDLSNVVPRHINPPFLEYIYRNSGVRIVGGEEATPNQFPFQAALFITIGSATYFCGGTLISPKYVLTAAHCPEGASSIRVLLGAHNIRDTEPTQVSITTSTYKLHENWDSGALVNDIAIIELPNSVELNEYISTVRLPSYSDASNTFAGTLGTAAGWGRPSDSSNSISDVLRYVQTNIITNLLCNISFLGIIQNTHICINGSEGKSTCNGDSGGPLLAGDVQVGITSFGIALGCEVGWPAVFTRVTSYLSWIEQNSDVVISQ